MKGISSVGPVIEDISAWQAFDSRGTPTVAVVVRLNTGHEGRAIAPAGASVGSMEAAERRDGGRPFNGLGVEATVRALIDLTASLRGQAVEQELIDRRLAEINGPAHLGHLGANASIAVSIAVLRAAAASANAQLYEYLAGIPLRLPLPMFNVLSGGRHAGRAVDLQDFLIVPHGARDFAEAVAIGWEIRASAGELGRKRGFESDLVADEGGFGFPLVANRDGIEFLLEAVEATGLVPGRDVGIALDMAANQLWDGSHYVFAIEDRRLDTAEMIDEVEDWVSDYPSLVSIEDPLHDKDVDGWTEVLGRLGQRLQVLGDDLFASQTRRVEEGAGVWANAVLIKPNQVGLLSRARSAFELARRKGAATVVSARSGDTEEFWLADLAVGWNADQVKVGSLTRSDRNAKWNRLLEIEARNPEAVFAGREGLLNPVWPKAGAV